jgi:hypothetical protein
MKLYLYSNEAFVEIGNIVTAQLGIKSKLSVFKIDDVIKTKFLAVSVFSLGEIEEKEIKEFFDKSTENVLMIASEEKMAFKKEYQQVIRFVNRGIGLNEAIKRVKENGGK